VGVVGAAGAGKSFLCALLAALLNHTFASASPPSLFSDLEGKGGRGGVERREGPGPRVGVLSMDAYHLRNEVLEASNLKHLKGKDENSERRR